MIGTYAIGQKIDERYRVTGVLGKGGHGVVYAAEDEMLASKVAVKCLAATLSHDDTFKLRMHREARMMGKLSGTSATQIFAFQKAKDGGLYIVMELLGGRDFETYLVEKDARGERMRLKDIVALLGPIADTLEVAHHHGIVHRDLKPANIFILDSTVRGGVRLLDFGLAKDMTSLSLTGEGMIAGSPGYIAPETWMGHAKDATSSIDVYALGCVVFRALAGRPPFDPKLRIDKLINEVTSYPRPSLLAIRRELPGGIDPWMQRALAIEGDDRFASIEQMWRELAKLVETPTGRVPLSIDVEMPWNVEIDEEIDVEVESIRSGRSTKPR